MDWSRIERHWATHFRALASKRWARLSERQLDGMAGRRLALAHGLQATYCVSPSEADRQLAEWQWLQVDTTDTR
jgi:hypothetical protein